MRWIWIDAIVEFETGRRAVAVKNVTAAEDHVHDLTPGCPYLPPSLIIEGMAQTAGILVGDLHAFRRNVVLAKVRRARLDEPAVPGDQLRYEAAVSSSDEAGAITTGRVSLNGKPTGEVDLIFSFMDPQRPMPGVPSENFVFTAEFRNLLDTFRGRNDREKS